MLLEHLPRKLSASPADAASIPASIAAFAEFLDAEGLLDPDGDRAEVIAHRALAQECLRRACRRCHFACRRHGPNWMRWRRTVRSSLPS